MRTKYAYIFLLLLPFVRDAYCARILGLFPHTGKSHHTVFEPLLRELAERGHHVTVVSFFPAKNPPDNYIDVSLEGLAPVGLETIDLNLFEGTFGITKLIGFGESIMHSFSFHPLAEMALNVCEKLMNFEPLKETLKKEHDIIIVENFNSDCMLGLAHVYGKELPIVSLLSSGLEPWSAERIGVSNNPSYVPATCAAFGGQMTLVQRVENTLTYYFLKSWFRSSIQVKEQAIIEKHFNTTIPDLNDLAKNTSLMLVNTYHSYYGVRPSVPGLVEVGGMHLDPKKQVIPPFIENFLSESENGVILFSFGSLIKTSTIPKYKEEIIIKVLSKLKQRVIWKYEDSDEKGTITGNILKVKWIPQYQLLKHKKIVAVIAHGGMSGTIEAISAGKPMLIMPFFGDQPLNGAAAENVGVGKVISYTSLTETSFSEALDEVLGARMRLNAREMAKLWKDRPLQPLDAAVYWIERVIRWGFKDKLYLPARDLNFVEYVGLDVLTAIILGTTVLIGIAMNILSIIAYCILFSLRKVLGKVKEKKQ